MDAGLQKQYEDPAKNPAHEESGKYSGIAKNKYGVGPIITQEIADKEMADDADDHSSVGGGQTIEKMDAGL
jgi:hypothetical protein